MFNDFITLFLWARRAATAVIFIALMASSAYSGTVPPSETSGLCTPPKVPQILNPSVVGHGSPESCTERSLKDALAIGGAITFDCGFEPHTITLTSQAEIALNRDTIIDGNGLVTLSGGGTNRIFSMDTGNFNNTFPTLTVINLTFRNGRSYGTKIPLGTHFDGGGGAIYYVGGNVRVFNSLFENNGCDDLGPDLAGGAIFGNGKGSTTIVDSTFSGNHCANGGAIGNLWTSTRIFSSVIENNQARGRGANYEGGEHGSGDGNQQGSGGNGGGIQMDGAENELLLCDVTIANNQGNALGGGVFRTTYFGTGLMTIDQSRITDNVITDQPDFSGAGALFFMGGPISITNTIFSNNEANIFGAIQFEDSSTVIRMDNVQITDNTARTGLAAIWIGEGVSGTISNSIVSNNSAPAPGGFAAAFAGNGIPQVTLSNTTILNNTVGNGYNPISCWGQFVEGGGNYQWPVARSGEGSDNPDALCSPEITVGAPPVEISVPLSPVLTVSTLERQVTVRWAAVIDAERYTLYYAPYPYTGEHTIGSIDMGSGDELSVELEPGAAFYVAVTAANRSGESAYSNIELFILE